MNLKYNLMILRQYETFISDFSVLECVIGWLECVGMDDVVGKGI